MFINNTVQPENEGYFSMHILKAIQSNRQILSELMIALEGVTNSEYCLMPRQLSSNAASPVGGHARHIIDFYHTFFLGVQRGLVDYSARKRHVMLETNRNLAISELMNIDKKLKDLPNYYDFNNERWEKLSIKEVVNTEGESLKIESGVIRELMFLNGHTVHHMALISVVLNLIGKRTPSTFGVAASTLIFQSGESTNTEMV